MLENFPDVDVEVDDDDDVSIDASLIVGGLWQLMLLSRIPLFATLLVDDVSTLLCDGGSTLGMTSLL